MRESSLRLLKDSTGSHAGADTVGRSSERKAEELEVRAGALSEGVETFVEDKRVKFDLSESVDLSEGEDARMWRDSGIPSRVVTRQIAPSARTGTDRSISENLLPSPKTKEETAYVSR
jgi:hypothetical protein